MFNATNIGIFSHLLAKSECWQSNEAESGREGGGGGRREVEEAEEEG